MLSPRYSIHVIWCLIFLFTSAPLLAQEVAPSKEVRIGTYSDSNAFNNYWRVKQYNDALKTAQPTYQRLHQNGEADKAEALRGIINDLKKQVNANFDKDMDKVLTKIMKEQKLDLIMRGKIIKQKAGVKVIDIADMVMIEISIKPEGTPDPFATLANLGKPEAEDQAKDPASLPENKGANNQFEVVVKMNKEAKLAIQGKYTPLNQLTDKLEELFGETPIDKRKITLITSASTQWRQQATVFNTLVKAGYADITIIADPSDGKLSLGLDTEKAGQILVNGESHTAQEAEKILKVYFENTPKKDRQVVILQDKNKTMSQLNTLIQLAQKHDAKISFSEKP